MKKIAVNSKLKVKTTADILWDNASDYTHFIHLHHRHFKQVESLYDDRKLKLFYYTSVMVPGLPFIKRYVAVRTVTAEDRRFRQVYQDLGSGRKVFHHLWVVQEGDWAVLYSRFVFELDGLAALLPDLVAWLVKRRLMTMWVEDLDITKKRFDLGGFDNKSCAPQLDTLHLDLMNEFDGMMKDGPDTLEYRIEAEEDRRLGGT